MSNECNPQSGEVMLNAAPLEANASVDYSYDQWRHAQMQQLEHDYLAVCRREERQMVSGDGERERKLIQSREMIQQS